MNPDQLFSIQDKPSISMIRVYKGYHRFIILMGKRELVVLLSLSSWCLLIVVLLFPTVQWVCLQFVIVEFPDHTDLLF